MSEVKNIPDGWVATTLGLIAEKMYSGGTPSTKREDYYGGNIPWIRTQEVVFNFINDAEIKISELGLKNSSARYIPKDTVIVAMYGNSAGRVALSKIKATTNQACCNIVSDPNISNPYFIFYNLLGRYREIEGKANGAAQQNLSVGVLKELEINLPTISEQKSIADILTAFDDKIELLQAQNKTLEETAQTIFTEWFGKYQIEDELPDGWKVGKLSEVGKIICGKTPSKSNDSYFGNEIPFIKIPDMHNKMFIIETSDNLSVEGAIYQKNKMLPKDSICISCIATVGLVSITTKDSQTNQQINSIIPKEKIYREYLYFTLTKMNNYLNDLGSGGTATLNVNTSTFSNIELIIPSEEKLNDFYKISNPIFEKVLKNNIQIQTLTKTRDELLPRLMSGEVRVNEFKK